MKHNGINRFMPSKKKKKSNNYLIYFLAFLTYFSAIWRDKSVYDGTNRFVKSKYTFIINIFIQLVNLLSWVQLIKILVNIFFRQKNILHSYISNNLLLGKFLLNKLHFSAYFFQITTHCHLPSPCFVHIFRDQT